MQSQRVFQYKSEDKELEVIILEVSRVVYEHTKLPGG